MKYLITLTILVSIALPSMGQLLVGNVDISKSDSVKIIEVLITERMSNKYVDVFVDFGQKSNFRSGYLENNSDDQRFNDATTKKPIRFKSTTAVLNYLEINNWEHYNSVVIADRGERQFYYYFRKK
ncbi:MAG: hypothetical protein ABIN80_05320 [Dyadobacter sp.]|uniref:hypothetical protein n=1 Tax=Dyadobacter sp. TaxID=1914288 RepID=UPI0032652E77